LKLRVRTFCAGFFICLQALNAYASCEDVLIRHAQVGDGAEIANVHLNAWREAYRDLLPQEFLDQLPLSFKQKMNMWSSVILDPKRFVLLVAEDKNGIVGFANFAAGRAPKLEEKAQLVALYLLGRYKGNGIGYRLLSSGMKCMKERGFKDGYCWVLEGNSRAIKFYEQTGATFTGQRAQDEIGGKTFNGLRYDWPKLEFD
jgi:GNAT superfamily N-acetyltransferase